MELGKFRMCPILLRNKIVVLRSAFLGIRLFKVGFSDVGTASSSYPIVVLCLSSSESASFERTPETMSWIQA